MSIALWCVLFAGLMPYLTVGFAKGPGGGYDNRHPREWAKSLSGFRARANAAHQNHFEFFPLFAVAVILAEWKAGAGAADRFAIAVIAFRLVYTAAYLADRPKMRSLFWFLAIVGNVSLFVVAARA